MGGYSVFCGLVVGKPQDEGRLPDLLQRVPQRDGAGRGGPAQHDPIADDRGGQIDGDRRGLSCPCLT